MDAENRKMQWQKKEMEKLIRENMNEISYQDVMHYKDVVQLYLNLVNEGKIEERKEFKVYFESDSDTDQDLEQKDDVSMLTSRSRLTDDALKKMKKRISYRYSKTGKLDETMNVDQNGDKRRMEQPSGSDERPKSRPRQEE